MEIRTAQMSGMLILGLQKPFISANHPGSNAPQVVGPLWDEMSKLFFQLPISHKPDFRGVGAMWLSGSDVPGEMIYFAGYEVSEVPEELNGLEVLNIPEANYAFVVHSGGMAGLPETTVNFYSNQLPKSGLERVVGMDLEIYGDNDENGMPTTVTICAPIK